MGYFSQRKNGKKVKNYIEVKKARVKNERKKNKK